MKNFLFVSLIFILLSCNIKEDPQSISSKLYAYSYAEDFVKVKLKDPKSADFPSSTEQLKHIKHMENWEYKIISYFHAKNSFNAVTKTYFECFIIVDKEKDEVRVRDLKILR